MRATPEIFYLLDSGFDPEERLENAALYKALRDEFGKRIGPCDDFPQIKGRTMYGRLPSYSKVDLHYWKDDAVTRHFNRTFELQDGEHLVETIKNMHDQNIGAFVKSTKPKHWIGRFPVGCDIHETWGDMAYSFFETGPKLLVQELVEMKFEWRFFCIGRRIVTDSPNAEHLTPLDHGTSVVYETPQSKDPATFSQSFFKTVQDALRVVAQDIATNMVGEDAVIDCAIINNKPGVVELNPMVPGAFGLFACDVRALARAIHDAHPRLAQLTGKPD